MKISNYTEFPRKFEVDHDDYRNFVGEKILQEISLENCEVEHDFSGGLSKRVTLKLSMIFLEASPRG